MNLPVKITATEPESPTYGLMWLDIGDKDGNGENDNVLKIFDGDKWLTVHFQ
jgi:hypothetical protein